MPEPIVFTDSAAAKVALIAEEGNPHGLKLRAMFVQGGGCSSFQYGFTFDEITNEDDTTMTKNGVSLLIGDELPTPGRRRDRLQGRPAGRPVRDQEPERHQHLRLRLNSRPDPILTGRARNDHHPALPVSPFQPPPGGFSYRGPTSRHFKESADHERTDARRRRPHRPRPPTAACCCGWSPSASSCRRWTPPSSIRRCRRPLPAWASPLLQSVIVAYSLTVAC